MADSGFKFSRLGGDGALDDDQASGHEALGDDIEKALREGDGRAARSEAGMPSRLMTTGVSGGGTGGYETGTRRTGKTTARWSLILMLLLGIVCFLSLVLSILAIKRLGELDHEEKIWTFAIGTDYLNLHYIDSQTDEMKGFDVEMVESVCSFAGKECRIVTDVPSRCWRSSDTGESGRGGFGLMNGIYDGCVGWSQTPERRRTFAFTEPYTKPLKSAFFVLNTTTDINLQDMSGKRIGFIDGYADDQFCLNIQDTLTGLPLQADQVLHFPSPEAATNALKNNSVDAIFTTEYVKLPEAKMLNGSKFDCATRGRSVMTRMDSHLEDWWNEAYSHVWRSKYYHLLCHTLELRHGKFDALPKEEICLHL